VPTLQFTPICFSCRHENLLIKFALGALEEVFTIFDSIFFRIGLDPRGPDGAGVGGD
jgi:hypothetical protein